MSGKFLAGGFILKHARPRVSLTPAQREEIVRKYLANVPNEAIAAEYGCDQSYPRQLFKRMGGPVEHLPHGGGGRRK